MNDSYKDRDILHNDTGSSYDDIIDLPRHISDTRPKMSVENRAAQFSPFAALTGYESAVKETARRTGEKTELDEDAKATLDMKLHMLVDLIDDHPQVFVTFFKKDEKKNGGAYITAVDNVNKIDSYKKTVNLMNGKKIPIDDILDIESDVFKDML